MALHLREIDLRALVLVFQEAIEFSVILQVVTPGVLDTGRGLLQAP